MQNGRVVDADGHVLEPVDMWENYLESKYKDRAIKWKVNEQGLDYWQIEGRPSVNTDYGINAALGGVAGYPDKDGDRTKLMTPGVYNYLDGAPPGSMDSKERVELLDEEGIDAALLYPTLGIFWEEDVVDPDFAIAMARAYNDWLIDFCKPYPDRLYAVAHIPILDVEDAVGEMRRMAKLGAKGFFVRPDLFKDRTLAHPDNDPIWAEAQDMDLPIAPHVVVRANHLLTDWSRSLWPNEATTLIQENIIFTFAYLMLDVHVAFTAMMTTGVFERFPRLKYVILESGGGWIAHWLDRMESKYKVGKTFSPMKEEPGFYFDRQCYISVDPDEKTTAAMVELLGEDHFVWASDFPHIDAEYGPVEELKEQLGGLSERARRKILGDNAVKIYNLG